AALHKMPIIGLRWRVRNGRSQHSTCGFPITCPIYQRPGAEAIALSDQHSQWIDRSPLTATTQQL
ncbi:MAG: hypothetical protein AAGJ55_10330, partial [Cyanobacteria bacterium J06555_12]